MLTLPNRTCQIGTSINTRNERHGDDDVPAMDIPLSGLMLTAEELNAFAQDGGLHAALFRKRPDGFSEPILVKFKPLAYAEKFEHCNVTLLLGLNRSKLVIRDCKLRRVTLAPLAGGLTELSFQVQCTPEMDEAAELFAHLNHSAEVEIEVNDPVKVDDEPELPLEAA